MKNLHYKKTCYKWLDENEAPLCGLFGLANLVIAKKRHLWRSTAKTLVRPEWGDESEKASKETQQAGKSRIRLAENHIVKYSGRADSMLRRILR